MRITFNIINVKANVNDFVQNLLENENDKTLSTNLSPSCASVSRPKRRRKDAFADHYTKTKHPTLFVGFCSIRFLFLVFSNGNSFCIFSSPLRF